MTEDAILEIALEDWSDDDHQIFDGENHDGKGEMTLPVVEQVDGGAWVLARVWVPIEEET